MLRKLGVGIHRKPNARAVGGGRLPREARSKFVSEPLRVSAKSVSISAKVIGLPVPEAGF